MIWLSIRSVRTFAAWNQTLALLLPSWELTYPFPKHFWRWFSFPQGWDMLPIGSMYEYIYNYIYTYIWLILMVHVGIQNLPRCSLASPRNWTLTWWPILAFPLGQLGPRSTVANCFNSWWVFSHPIETYAKVVKWDAFGHPKFRVNIRIFWNHQLGLWGYTKNLTEFAACWEIVPKYHAKCSPKKISPCFVASKTWKKTCKKLYRPGSMGLVLVYLPTFAIKINQM